MHKKAPPFDHTIEPIDLNNLTTPYHGDIEDLPHLWGKHMKRVSVVFFNVSNLKNYIITK